LGRTVGDLRTHVRVARQRAEDGLSGITRVRRFVAETARRALAKRGFSIVRTVPYSRQPIPADCDPETAETIRAVQPYTLTSPDRIMGLCLAVRYLVRSRIEGAIVECGVWRGGSIMAIARTLLSLGVTDRDIYMYDTFTEMPDGGPLDEVDLGGRTWDEARAELKDDPILGLWPLERVRELVQSTGYPPERLHFVQGLVEDNIPAHAPERIALCRLDTDWYESTAHELRHLYPRIVPGGVLLLDDYGEFQGARRAVDEYFADGDRPILLQRLDWAGRMAVVPGSQQPGRQQP
jgi:O-methyltransferase